MEGYLLTAAFENVNISRQDLWSEIIYWRHISIS